MLLQRALSLPAPERSIRRVPVAHNFRAEALPQRHVRIQSLVNPKLLNKPLLHVQPNVFSRRGAVAVEYVVPVKPGVQAGELGVFDGLDGRGRGCGQLSLEPLDDDVSLRAPLAAVILLLRAS